MAVVAGGVETKGQLEMLSKEGCDSYQGVLFQQASFPSCCSKPIHWNTPRILSV